MNKKILNLKQQRKLLKLTSGDVLKERRNEVFLCSKFGAVMSPNGEFKGISSTPEYVHQACENSLKILYLIRSLKIPVSVLVKEGKLNISALLNVPQQLFLQR
ncbi:unnamed protein product [Rhizophagus irregularis]|nr:unnamed protein product [Rhizophagus irregularis]